MKVRIDKWLWSIRVYKSRTMATDACKSGKIKLNGENAKPSTMISINEIAHVKKDGFTFQYKVINPIEKRVGAAIAITCYVDVTPPEEKDKYNAWFTNSKGPNAMRERGTGRPTKRDRRDIDGFVEGDDEDDFEEDNDTEKDEEEV
jgi:ribosome-associated heat shock protein Hsp15